MKRIDHRDRVLLFLKFFSSTSALERLIQDSGIKNPADRLCSLWIDDLYIPGLRYRDGLKGDRTSEGVAEFESQFSTSERALLAQFHRFLELRLEMLPKRRPEERAFPRGDFWQSIISHARRILEEIDPEDLEMDAILDRSAEFLQLSGGSGDQ